MWFNVLARLSEILSRKTSRPLLPQAFKLFVGVFLQGTRNDIRDFFIYFFDSIIIFVDA